MKYRILLLPAMFLFGSLGAAREAAAQTTPPQPETPGSGAPSRPPAPQPAPQMPSRGTITNNSRSLRDNTREVDEAFDRLRALEVRQSEGISYHVRLNEVTRDLYRKANKKELKVLSPSAAQMEKYALFLKQSDTGIVKLNSDASCAADGKINVIVAKESCLPYSMPGGGTSFSFRAETYRVPHLADLILAGDVIKTDGVLQQGIMVSLGDVPIEQVTLETRGLKYLTDFQPFSDRASLINFDTRLLEGIKSDGFTYGIGFYVKNQSTFALRSVAYKGKFVRSINGIAYNEMDFDKRKDILVAFRIVEQEPVTGNITLVWKILSRKDAPSWKFKKKEDK
jgi:hypothetical protein